MTPTREKTTSYVDGCVRCATPVDTQLSHLQHRCALPGSAGTVEVSAQFLADVAAALSSERERISRLNKRIDELQKSKPAFLTEYQRMWDLVRHQRTALLDAGLITRDEYGLLLSDESERTKTQGSPAPRRLESYDAVRRWSVELEQRNAALIDELNRLRAELQRGAYTPTELREAVILAATLEGEIRPVRMVGCLRPDGKLNVHLEADVCDVCRVQ